MVDKDEQRRAIQQALKAGKVPELALPGWSPEKPLFYYQRTGVAWLYVTPRALLADSTGTGKTAHALALLQRLHNEGQLNPQNRAIIICPAKSVLGSWKSDGFDEFVPGMKVAVVGQQPKAKRREIYDDPSWEVLLVNYELVRIDIDLLEPIGFKYAILDEVHYVRNHETKTALAVKKITIPASRVVGMTATPIQNHLLDLHGIMEVLGLGYMFGTKEQFARRHHLYRMVKVRYNGRNNDTKKLVGLKNTVILKKMIEPFYLRRSYKDIKVPIPSMKSQTIWLDMTPKQQRIYDAIKNEEIAKLKEEGFTLANLKNVVLRLQQLAVTTAFFHEEDHSAKFDWLMDKLTGDWQDEKIIPFSKWHPSLRALGVRLKEAGIGFVVITGKETKAKREEARQRFWNDPNCKVLLGTSAIEESLNLQCAKAQVNIDSLWNPARHDQLAGRHRRVGSVHEEVWVFSLFIRGSIEEAIHYTLRKKQAVMDHMFDETSELFDTLSAAELQNLIES
jgi:SNF2 family DNA or RNA helicase